MPDPRLPLSLPVALLFASVTWAADPPKANAPPASLKYLWATAYHIPPETTTEESGYFALCEGKDGKIYVGTAAYGRNSYLVEFDPKTEKMRVVLDSHRLVGLPAEPTGYAAQSKIHTRNFVGPSGLIYLGTKQGYPTAEEKKTGKVATYRGGFGARYDPATDKVTVDPLVVDGQPFAEVVGPKAVHPDWRLAADGKTAYLQLLNDLRMFEVDLGGEAGRPVAAKSLGNRVEGKNPDS